MIWTTKRDKMRKRSGEARLVDIFCWYPLKFGDNWYWLETIKVRQEVRSGHHMSFGEYPYKWRTDRLYDETLDRRLL